MPCAATINGLRTSRSKVSELQLTIDHVNLPVLDLRTSEKFYQAALAPLGLSIIGRDADAIGWGRENWNFGIVPASRAIDPLHIAFSAPSRHAVDGFYEAGLKAGGTDNGRPGPRPEYGPNYYAAYLLDPNGHNVEALCRQATL